VTLPTSEAFFLYIIGLRKYHLENEVTTLADDLTALTTPTTSCFFKGTLILTPYGERRVEDLVSGDLISTQDNGPQPIAWMCKNKISAKDMKANPDALHIRFSKGSLGYKIPHRDLILVPNHRLLIDDWRASYLFEESKVLATAVSLQNGKTVRAIKPRKISVEYYHLVFENHEIITANGALSESLLLSDDFINSLSVKARAELGGIFTGALNTTDAVHTQPVARLLTEQQGQTIISLI
jgi:hypothetical protein